MLDETELERVRSARRMAHKLAKNTSKNRTVRKLPQSVIVLPASGLHRAYPGREALHQNKRLAYIMLLGAVMCAYMYDIDLDTLSKVVKTVSVEAHKHLGPILGNT
jgi:hypothetical protein